MDITFKIDESIEMRPLMVSDAADIFEIIDSQRDYLGKWLPFVEFTIKLEDTEKFLHTVVNAPYERFEHVFAIVRNGKLVGIVGFKATDRQNKKTEIGYWLSEKFQKQGIITKSVRQLCKFAFDELDINRIQIKCAVGNTASSNIPKRLGFKFEGIERSGELYSGNKFFDIEVYSILKGESLD